MVSSGQKIENLLNSIKKLAGKKILSLSLSSGTFSFDISSDAQVGYEKGHEQMLIFKLKSAIQYSCGLTVRQFMPFKSHENERGVTIPFKNLYGFYLGDGTITSILKNELEIALKLTQIREIQLLKKKVYFIVC